MSEFIREDRYLVFKRKDIDEYLSKEAKEQLENFDNEIDMARADEDKPSLECVVVEHDWPEYEPTWQAIEKRVTGA